MGYVRTPEEVARIQHLLSPSRYTLEGVSIEFETTVEFINEVLPPCFEPTEPRGLATTTVWQSAVCGEFESAALMVYARYGDIVGTYFLTLVVSGDMPVVLGRELWGEPKKRGTAQLFRDGDTLYGYGERNGTRLIEIDATFDTDLGPQQSTSHALELTAALTHRGELAASPLAKVFTVDRDMQTVRAGSGTLRLTSGPLDPVGDVPIVSCGAARHYTGTARYDQIAQATLTDGEQYLPYILGRSFDDLTQLRRPRRLADVGPALAERN